MLPGRTDNNLESHQESFGQLWHIQQLSSSSPLVLYRRTEIAKSAYGESRSQHIMILSILLFDLIESVQVHFTIHSHRPLYLFHLYAQLRHRRTGRRNEEEELERFCSQKSSSMTPSTCSARRTSLSMMPIAMIMMNSRDC